MPSKIYSAMSAILFFILLSMSVSTPAYANNNAFQAPKFDITLIKSLKLISKTEEPRDGFYRYDFSSSPGDDAKLGMRVIVSNKQPKKNQSMDTYQFDVLTNISITMIEHNNLYQYFKSSENEKMLASHTSDKIKLGSKTYAGLIWHFGDMDASFLVTNSHNMTYAFTLLSNDTNKSTRTKYLKALTKQLETIKFK